MAMSLGHSYLSRLNVHQIVGAELAALSAQTHETATMSLRVGDTRVYIDQVTPAREVIMSVSIGQPYPLHAGASSKAFLAFLPDDEINAYLAHKLTPLTAATVVDPVQLRAELQEIRSRGWAESRGERQLGAASVAAPVLDHSRQPVGVISVCGPAERFTAEMSIAVDSLLVVTGRASRHMGFRPNQ
jgi:IclR family transcriptional regulator, acetate operon repressor